MNRDTLTTTASASDDRGSVSSAGTGELIGDWKQICQVKMNELYKVTKFRNVQVGADLIHSKIPGPYIHCYWVIPHVLEDDLGAPHILQNMLWQGGSKLHPYPGLLQRVAVKSLSAGLKSHIAKDHSSYHITVAGREGFQQLFPIAFDHIFGPELNEVTFLQDVYRMDGNGVEDGRCFHKMIRAEKDPSIMTTLELIQKAFGQESQYCHSEYGKVDELRAANLDTIEKVKAFHQKFFHLSNCCLIITGDIEQEEVLPITSDIMENYSSDSSWEKPWAGLALVDPVSEASINKLEYPSTHGNESEAKVVKVGILGPHSTEKLNRCVAMRIVLEYLVSGPLLWTCLEHFGAEASTTVTLDMHEIEFKQTLFTIQVHHVPTIQVDNIPQIFRRAMEEQISGSYDHAKMMQTVYRVHQEDLTKMENDAAEKIYRDILPDYLYSTEDSDLMFDRRVNSSYTIDNFTNQKPEFWKYVLQACILDTKWITVAAIPSSALAANEGENENERLQQRVDDDNVYLTKSIAQKSRTALREGLKQDDKNAPLLESFQFPLASSIGMAKITRYDNPKWASDTPCNIYFDDITSSYVFVTVLLDTSELEMEEKKYLLLFSQGILNSPYQDSTGVFWTAEELKQRLTLDCISYDSSFGLEWFGKPEDKTEFTCGSFSHLLCLRFQFDVAKIRDGLKLVQQVLWGTMWQAEMLISVCAHLVNRIENELLSTPSVMTRTMLTDFFYKIESVPQCLSLARQLAFLRKIYEELPNNFLNVSRTLEGIREVLLKPQNCTVHIAGSLGRMDMHLTEDPNDRDAVKNLFKSTFVFLGKQKQGATTKRLANQPDADWMKNPDECLGGKVKCSREHILRVEDDNVSHLIQASGGVTSCLSLDYPLLLLAVQYFTQDGGPLKEEVIRHGKAHDIAIEVSPSQGLIYFEMRNCPNLASSYATVYNLMKEYCEAPPDDPLWSERLLMRAKSILIFHMTKEEGTPNQLSHLSLLAHYKGMPKLEKLRRGIMDRITGVTIEDLQQITVKYFKPLFLETVPCAAAVPHESVFHIIKEFIESCNKKLNLYPPLEKSSLVKLTEHP